MKTFRGGRLLGLLAACLGCGAVVGCTAEALSGEDLGAVEQALTSHSLVITPHQHEVRGWGVFGTGNPGPDAQGCARFNSRTDCIRVCPASLTESFNNELAWPNFIAGDNGSDPDSHYELFEIDQYTNCSAVPQTIPLITLEATLWSSGGQQGTVNAIGFVVEARNVNTFMFVPGVHPPANGNPFWSPAVTVDSNSLTGPIPKSAICGAPSERWGFGFGRDQSAFPNESWDASDWIAVGCVRLKAYW